MEELFNIDILAQKIANLGEPNQKLLDDANSYITEWRTNNVSSYIEALFSLISGGAPFVNRILTLLIAPFQTAISALRIDEEEMQRIVPPPELVSSILEVLFSMFENPDPSIRNISSNVYGIASALLLNMEVDLNPLEFLFEQLSSCSDENVIIAIFNALSQIFQTTQIDIEKVRSIYSIIIPILETNENNAINSAILKLLTTLSSGNYFRSIFEKGSPELIQCLTAVLGKTQNEELFNDALSFWSYTISDENNYLLLEGIGELVDFVISTLENNHDNEELADPSLNFIYFLENVESNIEQENSYKYIANRIDSILTVLLGIASTLESDDPDDYQSTAAIALQCIYDIIYIPTIFENKAEELFSFAGEALSSGEDGQIEVGLKILEASIDICDTTNEAINSVLSDAIQYGISALSSTNIRIIYSGITLLTTIIMYHPDKEFAELVNSDLLDLLDSDNNTLSEAVSNLIDELLRREIYTNIEELFNELVGRRSSGSLSTAYHIYQLCGSQEMIAPHLVDMISLTSLAIDGKNEKMAAPAMRLATAAAFAIGEPALPYVENLFNYVKQAYELFKIPETITTLSDIVKMIPKFLRTVMTIVLPYTNEQQEPLMQQSAIEAVNITLSHFPIQDYIGQLVSNLIRVNYSKVDQLESKIDAIEALSSLLFYHWEETAVYLQRIVHLYMTAIKQYENIIMEDNETAGFLAALMQLSTVFIQNLGPNENIIPASLQLIQYVIDSNIMNRNLAGDFINLLSILMEISIDEVKAMAQSKAEFAEIIKDLYSNLEEEQAKIAEIASTLDIPLEIQQEPEGE